MCMCVLKTTLTLFSLLPIASCRIGSVGTLMSTVNNVYSELWLHTRLPVYLRSHKLRYDWGSLRKLSTSYLIVHACHTGRTCSRGVCKHCIMKLLIKV